MDSVRHINEVLGQMGEPPLSKTDKVQTRFVEDEHEVAEVGDEKQIHLVEPPGFKRCELVFTNGRQILLDMQYDELVAAVREFLGDGRRDFLELPNIQVLGGRQQPDGSVEGGVIIALPTSFSRRALEGVQSMSICYAKRVPGQETPGAKGKVAVIRGAEAKHVLVDLNNAQRRQLERQNGRG